MIGRFALRIAAIEALKGQTLVGQNVQDSSLSAIDIEADGTLRTLEDQPFISVYTDDGTATEDETPVRDLLTTGSLDLVFEFGIATPMTDTDPETGASVIVGLSLPPTDAHLELALDVIDRGIARALTDPANAWAEVWRDLHERVERIERRRAASGDDNQRFAARQVRYTLDVLPDPVPGEPLRESSSWMRFKARLDADRPDLSAVFAAMLGAPGEELTLAMIQQGRGQTTGEMRAFGLFHPTPAEPGEYETEKV